MVGIRLHRARQRLPTVPPSCSSTHDDPVSLHVIEDPFQANSHHTRWHPPDSPSPMVAPWRVFERDHECRYPAFVTEPRLNPYGDNYADMYDELFGAKDNLQLVVRTLEKLAGGGGVLEFGVGTGRIAIPLAERGIDVTGVDNSQRMLDRMFAKPGGQLVKGLVGDMAEIEVEGEFSLVLLAFSTLFLMNSQEGQARVFENAGRHLRSGGIFVVEVFVHDRSRWASGSEATTVEVGDDCARLRLGTHDPVSQVIRTQTVTVTSDGLTLLPNSLRYAWPAELDLMARIAGFERESWWSGWDQDAFGARSDELVAVYRKA